MKRDTFRPSLVSLGLSLGLLLGLVTSPKPASAEVTNRALEDARQSVAGSQSRDRARAETLVLSPIEARELERSFLAGGEVSVLPAAAFSSDESVPESQFFSFSSGRMTGDDEGAGCVKARVYVRDDIDISGFSVTVIDDNAGSDMFFNLYRVESFNGGTDTLASIVSSGSTPDIQVLSDSTILNPTVNQPTYSYYVAGCLQGPSLALISARVFYDIGIFSDGFESGNTDAWDSTVGN